MPRAIPGHKALGLIRRIGAIYDSMLAKHMEDLRIIGNRIPVGGQHMDLFFMSEGLRGVLSSLRNGGSVDEAIEHGKQEATFAVKKWNARREYQVHRWDSTAHDFIEWRVRSLEKL